MATSVHDGDEDLFATDGDLVPCPPPAGLPNVDHIQLPRRSAITLTTTRSGLHITSPGLPAIAAIAARTHWEISASACRLGIAPPLAGFRIATLVVQQWVAQWIASGAWLPADLRDQARANVLVLAHHCLALHPRMARRLWTYPLIQAV